MKRIFLSIVFFAVTMTAFAAINAQYDFESGLPDFVSVNGNGKVEYSAEKFKDGSKSVKLSWNGPAELVFSNFSDMEASMKVNGAGLMFWIYNSQPMKDPVTFTILDWNMNEICHFDVNADFKGWRAIWIKYIDMLSPYGHYGDKKAGERVTEAAGMIMKVPESVKEGSLYIDRLTFAKTKLHNQITPDQQIPQNNWNLERDMWQWCRLWEWEQYQPWQIEKADKAKSDMLRVVEERIDRWAEKGNPGSQ